jgi:hypothetical protein
MARQIKAKVSVTEAEATISSLDGMSDNEKQLFFEVVKGSIAEIAKTTPIGQINYKQTLFKSHSKSAIMLGIMFVKEYRKLQVVSDMIDG